MINALQFVEDMLHITLLHGCSAGCRGANSIPTGAEPMYLGLADDTDPCLVVVVRNPLARDRLGRGDFAPRNLRGGCHGWASILTLEILIVDQFCG